MANLVIVFLVLRFFSKKMHKTEKPQKNTFHLALILNKLKLFLNDWGGEGKG